MDLNTSLAACIQITEILYPGATVSFDACSADPGHEFGLFVQQPGERRPREMYASGASPEDAVAELYKLLRIEAAKRRERLETHTRDL